MKNRFLYYLSAIFASSVIFTMPGNAGVLSDVNPYIQSTESKTRNNSLSDVHLGNLRIRFYETEQINKIYLSISKGELKYEVSPLTTQNRLVIDTYGTTTEDFNNTIAAKSEMVSAVRFEQINLDSSQPGVRVYIYTKHDINFKQQLLSLNQTLELELFSQQASAYNPDRKTIVIDPGHGGNDPGAVGLYGTKEKNITLSISQYLRQMLTDDGINVVMTRNKDQEVYLQPRIDLANRRDADIFVSIHANANTNRQPSGTETYYKTAQSQRLSQILQRNLIAELDSKDRGVKTANFAVIKRTEMPSVLMEVGFVSNPQEEKLLASDSYQKKIAVGIYNGIRQYFSISKT